MPRATREPHHHQDSERSSYITGFAEERRAAPTPAERKLEQILAELNGGVLKGRFIREHVISGKWIVDFYFAELRLAIEVDGSVHDTEYQRGRDRLKDADCARFDITVIRLSNREVFGDRTHLVKKLRDGWRKAQRRKNAIIGKRSSIPSCR